MGRGDSGVERGRCAEGGNGEMIFMWRGGMGRDD